MFYYYIIIVGMQKVINKRQTWISTAGWQCAADTTYLYLYVCTVWQEWWSQKNHHTTKLENENYTSLSHEATLFYSKLWIQVNVFVFFSVCVAKLISAMRYLHGYHCIHTVCIESESGHNYRSSYSVVYHTVYISTMIRKTNFKLLSDHNLQHTIVQYNNIIIRNMLWFMQMAILCEYLYNNPIIINNVFQSIR